MITWAILMHFLIATMIYSTVLNGQPLSDNHYTLSFSNDYTTSALASLRKSRLIDINLITTYDIENK